MIESQPIESPHPSVASLITLRRSGQRVLLLGVGSGRHLPALVTAGLHVVGVEPSAERRETTAAAYASACASGVVRLVPSLEALADEPAFDALLSTHALLHGTPASIAATLRTVRARLAPDAVCALTLGSRRDPRFGTGVRLDASTYAAESGSEAGIPHAYFDRDGAAALFADYELESLVEASAAETAGRWAHDAAEAARLVHWFALARRT